jgi:hypothetical protein
VTECGCDHTIYDGLSDRLLTGIARMGTIRHRVHSISSTAWCGSLYNHTVCLDGHRRLEDTGLPWPCSTTRRGPP